MIRSARSVKTPACLWPKNSAPMTIPERDSERNGEIAPNGSGGFLACLLRHRSGELRVRRDVIPAEDALAFEDRADDAFLARQRQRFEGLPVDAGERVELEMVAPSPAPPPKSAPNSAPVNSTPASMTACRSAVRSSSALSFAAVRFSTASVRCSSMRAARARFSSVMSFATETMPISFPVAVSDRRIRDFARGWSSRRGAARKTLRTSSCPTRCSAKRSRWLEHGLDRGNDRLDMAAEHRRRRPAEEVFGEAVPEDDRAGHVGCDHRLLDRFQKLRLEADLAFRLLLLRDVLDHRDLLERIVGRGFYRVIERRPQKIAAVLSEIAALDILRSVRRRSTSVVANAVDTPRGPPGR